MPKKYVRIKKNYLKAGKSEKKAKELAAKTYNAQRKPGQKPVTRSYHKKKR